MAETPRTDTARTGTPVAAPAPPSPGAEGLRRGAWTATALAFAFMLLNFADKAALGFAGSAIMRDLGITPAEFGVVQSSFFWLFAVGALVVGALSTRVSVRLLLPALMAVWILTMVPLLFPVGFGLLLVSRVVLGFAEGPAYALATHVVHSWFPPEKRALPAGVISAGSSVGPLIAAPVLTMVIATWDWHAAFLVLIVAGLVWLVSWFLLSRPSPEETTAASRPATRTRTDWRLLGRQLRTPTILGVALLAFVGYWTTTLRVSWLPLYLEQGLGYDPITAGRLVTAPYAVAAIAAVSAGFVSNRMIAAGISRRWARGGLSVGFVVTGGLCMYLFTVVPAGALQMVLVACAFSLNSAAYGVALTIVADLVRPGHRGAVLGCLVAFYSMAGVIAPLVLGFSIGDGASPAGYGVGFAISAVVIVVGGLLSLLFINPERDIARLQEDSGAVPG